MLKFAEPCIGLRNA